MLPIFVQPLCWSFAVKSCRNFSRAYVHPPAKWFFRDDLRNQQPVEKLVHGQAVQEKTYANIHVYALAEKIGYAIGRFG
jgi:hypothetical protein